MRTTPSLAYISPTQPDISPCIYDKGQKGSRTCTSLPSAISSSRSQRSRRSLLRTYLGCARSNPPYTPEQHVLDPSCSTAAGHPSPLLSGEWSAGKSTVSLDAKRYHSPILGKRGKRWPSMCGLCHHCNNDQLAVVDVSRSTLKFWLLLCGVDLDRKAIMLAACLYPS